MTGCLCVHTWLLVCWGTILGKETWAWPPTPGAARTPSAAACRCVMFPPRDAHNLCAETLWLQVKVLHFLRKNFCSVPSD